ncbi:MAG: sel1 repeat family protein [Muribaculaceae bacterium]|nr:sel1 repeat family protein [Muribaculaceae bacterium]
MKHGLPFLLISLLVCGCIWAQDTSPQEPGHQLRTLIERADSGDLRAIYQLAYLHDTGYDSIPVDSMHSTALYLLAARQGYAPARNFIGFRYYRGEYVKKDIDSALYWIRLAALDGDITGAANMAYLLLDSPDIPHDNEEGEKWLTIAAEAGVTEAQQRLIEIKEEEWLQLTPDSALIRGMELYLDRAPVIGVKLIEIGAKNNIPKAMALLGDAYSKGRGVPYSHQKSIEYFYKAAMAGDGPASFLLAELLEFFPDVLISITCESEGTDENDAGIWYSRALSQGIADSETAYKLLFSIPENNLYRENH